MLSLIMVIGMVLPAGAVDYTFPDPQTTSTFESIIGRILSVGDTFSVQDGNYSVMLCDRGDRRESLDTNTVYTVAKDGNDIVLKKIMKRYIHSAGRLTLNVDRNC